jgi:hypothetical protein
LIILYKILLKLLSPAYKSEILFSKNIKGTAFWWTMEPWLEYGYGVPVVEVPLYGKVHLGLITK